MKIENRYTREIIYENKKINNIKELVEEAILKWISLKDADLSGADLSGANLKYGNLKDADLRLSNLDYIDFKSTNLSGADLSGASLRSTILYSFYHIGIIITDDNDIRGMRVYRN